MEREAAHWNRMAFLRRCLRIFLIGTGDLKRIPLDVCFTPRLIPMLTADMQRKVERGLSINIKDMDGGVAEESTPEGASESARNDDSCADLDLTEDPGTSGGSDGDGDDILDVDDDDEIDELGEEDSGFGLEGKPARFCSSKFWNYVDYMLTLIIMIQIFQDDLLDCPGRRKVTKLTTVNPPWQTTIQHGLMW
ncbi:hypothetical protein EDD15DRAFT_2380048 [Pisolithus albus]|nr:hypothetical protein EDD15DRAFT_2381415 [Pisolithus albus]KAI5981219.1 hypothetical protein EDD15DRAFT_2380048 [Pisolithus albus]